MPQIGWFEILIIVVVAILVIGPKDFPVVLRKIGNFIGSTKRYFTNIQNKMNKLDETFAYYAGQFANIAVDKLTGIDLLGDVVGGVVQRSLSN